MVIQWNDRAFAIPCVDDEDDSSRFNVTIWIRRASPVEDFDYFRKEANLSSDSKPLKEHRFKDFILDNPNTTAIVANTGIWMSIMENYTTAVDSLLSWVDSFSHKKDKILAFFRSTLPGHFQCYPMARTDNITADILNFDWAHPLDEPPPFRDYAEYRQTELDVLATANRTSKTINLRNYLGIESYNAYARQLLEKRRSSNRGIPFHWINTFDSGVLRRDGHRGLGDCLHFSFPGPTDWWAHLFHSMLVDLADDSTSSSMADTADAELSAWQSQ